MVGCCCTAVRAELVAAVGPGGAMHMIRCCLLHVLSLEMHAACHNGNPSRHTTKASHLYLAFTLRHFYAWRYHPPTAARNHASAVRNTHMCAHIYTLAAIGKMGGDTPITTCVDFCSGRAIRPIMMARGLGPSLTAPVTLVLLHPGVRAVWILLHPQLELFTLCTREVPLCCHLSQLGLCGHAPCPFSLQLLHSIDTESVTANRTMQHRIMPGLLASALARDQQQHNTLAGLTGFALTAPATTEKGLPSSQIIPQQC